MLRKLLLGVSLATLVLSAPAFAQMSPLATTGPIPAFNKTGTGPDIKGISFFDGIVASGAKLYYMGERSSLYGWLIVKDGQMQMVYMTADRKSVLIGAMFTDSGELVTNHQVNAVAEKNKEIADILSGNAVQQIDVTRAAVTDGGVATVDSDPRVTASLRPATSMPALPVSPGERLMLDLQAASGVVLGQTQDAPELVMIVSPDCGYCKRTWDEMRDVVYAGKIKVRLVPIARDSATDETRKAAQLLRVSNPLEVWDAYVRGNKESLAGEPDSLAYRAIVGNRDITDRWNILGTPYLLYRNKDGKIKIVQGKPERMAAVLADLIR